MRITWQRSGRSLLQPLTLTSKSYRALAQVWPPSRGSTRLFQGVRGPLATLLVLIKRLVSRAGLIGYQYAQVTYPGQSISMYDTYLPSDAVMFNRSVYSDVNSVYPTASWIPQVIGTSHECTSLVTECSRTDSLAGKRA